MWIHSIYRTDEVDSGLSMIIKARVTIGECVGRTHIGHPAARLTAT
jgi:hypothetical protein